MGDDVEEPLVPTADVCRSCVLGGLLVGLFVISVWLRDWEYAALSQLILLLFCGITCMIGPERMAESENVSDASYESYA